MFIVETLFCFTCGTLRKKGFENAKETIPRGSDVEIALDPQRRFKYCKQARILQTQSYCGECMWESEGRLGLFTVETRMPLGLGSGLVYSEDQSQVTVHRYGLLSVLSAKRNSDLLLLWTVILLRLSFSPPCSFQYHV